MSTTSLAPKILGSVIATLSGGDYPYDVFETWPGPDGARRMLFFGDIEWTSYTIPTIQAGRRQRQEEFTIAWAQWTFGGSGKPSDPEPARTDAFNALAKFEDALADDPTLGLGLPTIQSAQLTPLTAGPFAYERGWGYRIEGDLTVAARLT